MPKPQGMSLTVQRIFFAVVVVLVGAVAQAQTQPKRGPRPGEVESDPIRCWWKTDRSAIRVGEHFTLVLTCGVIETSTVKVVPVLNQLEPGAVSLTPFEAIAGERREHRDDVAGVERAIGRGIPAVDQRDALEIGGKPQALDQITNGAGLGNVDRRRGHGA